MLASELGFFRKGKKIADFFCRRKRAFKKLQTYK